MQAWRKNIRNGWQRLEWPCVAVVWLLTLYLGYIGFAKHAALNGLPRTAWDLFYLSLQLFTLESGSVLGTKTWELEAARLLAPVAVAYTAWKAIAALFYARLQILQLRFLQRHTVVCGLGRKGFLLTKALLERQEPVVIIEQEQDNSFIEQAKQLGAIVLVGNATDTELLRKARVCWAKYLICVCGSDGVNAEVAVNACELLKEHRQNKVLTCLVHILDPQLCYLLKEREITTQLSDSFRLEFFNVSDSGAQALLKIHPPFNETNFSKRCPPHFLIIGLGSMGTSLLLHLAGDWRDKYFTPNGRLRMTVIDWEAKRKTDSLCLRYAHLNKVCDLDIQEMDIHWPEFERANFLYSPSGECDITGVYICFDNDALGLAAGLAVFQKLKATKIPIIVRMVHDAGLAMLVKGVESGVPDNIRVFGLLDHTCKMDLLLGGTHEVLARAIHEDYVRNQERIGRGFQNNQSMVPWDELPEDLKDANRRQADHIGTKLRTVECGIMPMTDWSLNKFEFNNDEIELLAKMEHTRWMDNLLTQGWAYAAGPSDAARKTHPCLMPWDRLSFEMQDMDRNTVRNLPIFLYRAGFQIYRLGQ